MKKIISISLLIVLTFSLSACNKSNNTSSQLDAGVQSDVSSIDTSAENTTTSEENSTNTPSANKTPSKTEESNPTNVAGEYTVTFDYGYDNIKTTTKSKNYKVANPGNPTREGYNFCGWYAANEETCWNFAGHVVTEDITLTARWAEIMVSMETQSQESSSQNVTSQETQSQESSSQNVTSQESSSIPS